MKGLIGVALLLVLTGESHGFFWHKCPYKSQEKDPRVCGSDGKTYDSMCNFKMVQSLYSWLKLLKHGPCTNSEKENNHDRPGFPSYSKEELDNRRTKPRRPPSYSDEVDEYYKPTKRPKPRPPVYSEEYDYDYYRTTRRRRPRPPKYSEEFDDYYRTTRRRRPRPKYSEEYDDYYRTTRRRRPRPKYSEEYDDYYRTTRPRRPRPPKYSEEFEDSFRTTRQRRPRPPKNWEMDDHYPKKPNVVGDHSYEFDVDTTPKEEQSNIDINLNNDAESNNEMNIQQRDDASANTDVNLNNTASNANDINIKNDNNKIIDIKIDNESKNKNKINIGRQSFPYFFVV